MSIWKQLVSELAAEDARKEYSGDPFDAKLALVRAKKERLFRYLTDLADQTPMPDRKWFRLSEIADYCAKLPGFVIEQVERNRALESLRLAILSGAFCDKRVDRESQICARLQSPRCGLIAIPREVLRCS
jgi:hypothetical protein